MEKEEKVVKAVLEGHPMIRATGNYHDFVVNKEKVFYRPKFIANCLAELGYVVLTYSFSAGLKLHDKIMFSKEIADQVDKDTKAVGLARLLNKERKVDPEEIYSIFRDMSTLLQLPSRNELKYCWIISYLEHLISDTNSGANETTMVAETLHGLNYSIALRKSGNCIICFSKSGLQNDLLSDIYQVQYGFPLENEIVEYTEILAKRLEN
jgi:hypothetical protein